MLIDCDACLAPEHACRDCVVTVLLGGPPVLVELDDDERAALGSLARVGLVPPLRLATSDPSGSPGSVRDIA